MHERLAIVTPVLDDWESFGILARRISELYSGSGMSIHILAVDDGSATTLDPRSVLLPDTGCVDELKVVRLAVNLGHQRAIAVGLSQVADRSDIDFVIVIDSDGEDRPEDIATLRSISRAHPGCAVLARRASRSESPIFKLGYLGYKALFRILTGRTINFGNFSLLPMSTIRRLVYLPDLWNNLAAALMRSRLEYITVPVDRGTRYSGRSKMNFASLVVHGLSAMSVYTDLIFVRVLLVGAMLAVFAMLGIAVVLALHFFASFGIPGWASTMIGDLAIILVQVVVLIAATSLMVLASRSHRQIVPAIDARVFILPGDVAPGVPDDSGEHSVRLRAG